MKNALRSTLLLALAACIPLAHAQNFTTPTTQPWYFAKDFAYQVPSQAANTYQWVPASVCRGNANGIGFFPFAVGTKVLIIDQTPASNEVVNVSAISNTGARCQISIAPSNNHYSFQIVSGTAGLQESVNVLQGAVAYPALVILDRLWYTQAAAVPGTTPAAIIGALAGNGSVIVEDVTTAPATFYVPGSTSTYVAGTWTNVKATAAAGAAAGTAPTISNTGTAGLETVNLTEGTAPTTGVLFTLTWPTTGSFLYAPVCTVTSTGANAAPAFTFATSFASSAAKLTVSVSVAPVAGRAYQFQTSCK